MKVVPLSYIGAILLAFFLTVSGQDTKIVDQAENIVARAGGQAVLNCTVANKGDNPVKWVFLNYSRQLTSDCQVKEDHNNNVGGVKKYAVDCSKSEKGDLISLKINSLQFQDNGVFQCQIQIDNAGAGTDSDRMDVKLTVLVSPQMQSTKDLSRESFIGSNVSLDCQSRGVPSPNVTWGRADGRPLPTGRFNMTMIKRTEQDSIMRLSLFDLVASDRGTYRCSADNNIRPPAERRFKLSVQFQPTVFAVEPSYGAAIGELKQAMLWCQVAGNPLPTIQWYFLSNDMAAELRSGRLKEREITREMLSAVTNKLISTDEKYKVEQKIMTVGSLSTMESTFISLTVLSMRASDLGYYVCLASNNYGEDLDVITLYQVNDIADESRSRSGAASPLICYLLLILPSLFVFYHH